MLLSPEYREKFKGITGDPTIDDFLWEKSIEMHRHLEGTLREDMYLISLGQRKIVGAQTHSYVNYRVEYNKSLSRAKAKYRDLVTIHSHPVNSPPSGSDFLSNAKNGYTKGVVSLPNGDVWVYSADAYDDFLEWNVDTRVNRYIGLGVSVDEAYIKSYEAVKRRYGLKWQKR